MGDTIGFRPGDDLADAIESEQDRVEEETGYRPRQSDVIRRKLREAFDELSATDQKGAA